MASEPEDKSELVRLEHELKIARAEIKNLRQQLTTVSHVLKKKCEEIEGTIGTFRCNGCKTQGNTMNTINETEGASSSNHNIPTSVNMSYIGKIISQFPSKRGTPRQTSVCTEAVGEVRLNYDVLTNPHHALEGLEGFSHMWILFHFHQTESKRIHAKVAPPRLNGFRMGVFGTRSPHRPSPIGLSLVEITKISDNCIFFNGVDMINGTPVLDIKPYIPQYDSPIQSTPSMTQNDSSDEDEEMEHVESRMEHMNVRTLEGQETEMSDILPNTLSFENSRLIDLTSIRGDSLMGIREAPDGEEGGSVLAQLIDVVDVSNAVSLPVRIPQWVENPVVPTLSVQFKMVAEIQLRQLGSEGEVKKRIIKNVLSEDPRSVYLRHVEGGNSYVFRIAELFVSCEFSQDERIVYVHQVIQDGTADIAHVET